MSDLQELMVGSTRVVALKDGELTLPKEILLNVDEDTSKKLSDENNQLTNSQINAYLIFKNEKILLVDAGCRDLFGPTCGFVHEEIAKANVKPEDITDIFFTHLHPDHVGGSINKDGKAIFPNATINIIEDELNFWSKDDFEDVEINDVSTSAPPFITPVDLSISKVGLTLSRDTRDSILFPSNGSIFTLRKEFAGGIFGGDADYGRLEFQGARFMRTFDPMDQVLSIMGRVGTLGRFRGRIHMNLIQGSDQMGYSGVGII